MHVKTRISTTPTITGSKKCTKARCQICKIIDNRPSLKMPVTDIAVWPGNYNSNPSVRPWSTMECSQQAAWKTNRSLLVAPRVKAFPGRPTNSGFILPRAAHLEGGVIGSHQCMTSHSGSAPASPDMRQPPRHCPACIPSITSIPTPPNPQ